MIYWQKIPFIHVFRQSIVASVCLLYGCLPRNWINLFVLFMTQGYFWKCVLLSRQFLLWSIALAGGHGTELPPLARVSCVAPAINLHRLVRYALCLYKTICAALILVLFSPKAPRVYWRVAAAVSFHAYACIAVGVRRGNSPSLKQFRIFQKKLLRPDTSCQRLLCWHIRHNLNRWDPSLCQSSGLSSWGLTEGCMW